MKKWVLAISLCALSHSSIAEDKRQHSVHTHGLAEITIVYEDNRLIIELQTAAINMLGFEHKPHTAEQKDRLHMLETVVNEPDKLFTVNPACRSTQRNTNLPFTNEKHGHQHNNDHKKAGHEHEKAGHDDHDKHEHEGHRDIHLVYEWNCAVTDKLAVEVLLFATFPGFEKIQAQWVVGQRQGVAMLDKDDFTLEFLL